MHDILITSVKAEHARGRNDVFKSCLYVRTSVENARDRGSKGAETTREKKYYKLITIKNTKHKWFYKV